MNKRLIRVSAKKFSGSASDPGLPNVEGSNLTAPVFKRKIQEYNTDNQKPLWFKLLSSPMLSAKKCE